MSRLVVTATIMSPVAVLYALHEGPFVARSVLQSSSAELLQLHSPGSCGDGDYGDCGDCGDCGDSGDSGDCGNYGNCGDHFHYGGYGDLKDS